MDNDEKQPILTAPTDPDPTIPRVNSPEISAIPPSLSPSPVSTLPETTKRKNVLLIIFVLCAVILLAGLSYWLLRSQQKTTNYVVKPTPTATIDPTTNWNTYTNVKYGYVFKYPQLWLLQTKGAGQGIIGANKNSDDLNLVSQENLPGENISVNTYEHQVYPLYENYTHTSCQVGSVQADCYEGQKNETIYEKVARVSSSVGNFIDIRTTYKDDKLADPIFNQVLSSFKFFETTLDISNWKTYQDIKYGFQVSYPENWEQTVDTYSYKTVEGENKTNTVIKLLLGNTYEVDIDPDNEDVTIPIDKWINNLINEHQNCTDCPGTFVSLNSDQTTKIAGFPTIAVDGGSEGSSLTTYYFSHNQKVFSVSIIATNSLYGSDDYVSGEPERTYSTIFSTFKFLD